MDIDIAAIARRVKRGVRLLDKKIPDWRQILRKHRTEFDFRDGDHCVLGTLEHYSGRMRVLKARVRTQTDYPFGRALDALKLRGDNRDVDFGFDGEIHSDYDRDDDRDDEMTTLDALWRAEFEPDTEHA